MNEDLNNEMLGLISKRLGLIAVALFLIGFVLAVKLASDAWITAGQINDDGGAIGVAVQEPTDAEVAMAWEDLCGRIEALVDEGQDLGAPLSGIRARYCTKSIIAVEAERQLSSGSLRTIENW